MLQNTSYLPLIGAAPRARAPHAAGELGAVGAAVALP